MTERDPVRFTWIPSSAYTEHDHELETISGHLVIPRGELVPGCKVWVTKICIDRCKVCGTVTNFREDT